MVNSRIYTINIPHLMYEGAWPPRSLWGGRGVFKGIYVLNVDPYTGDVILYVRRMMYGF